VRHLVVGVEQQADGAVGGLATHAPVVLPLGLGVAGPALPQLAQGLGPRLLLLPLKELVIHRHLWGGGGWRGGHQLYSNHCIP